MKKYLLILTAFFTLTVAYAQTNINYSFNNRKDICDSLPDAGIKLIYWNNGILCLGFCYNSSQVEGMTLTYFDTLGNVKWKKIIFLPQYKYFQGNDILAINGNGFYVAGVVYKDTITQYDNFFAKFDVNGNNIFYKIYTDTASSYLMNMELFSPDSILLLSDVQEKGSGIYNKIQINEIDTLGNEWHTFLSNQDLKYGYQVLKGNNNKIYVGGTLRTSSSSNYNVAVFINVYDYNLNYITTMYPSSSMNERFEYLTILNNELYLSSLVSVYAPPNPNQLMQCQISKFNSSGILQNAIKIGPRTFDGDIVLENTSKLNSNCLVAPIDGTNDISDSVFSWYHNHLYFVDSALALICYTDVQYSSTAENEMAGIVILPNKKIAGTGVLLNQQNYAGESQDHWIFLTENAETFLANNCHFFSGITEVTNHEVISVFPNPFSTQTTLQTDIFFKNASLTIYNSVGQTVKQIDNLSGQTIILHRDNLPSGLYFIRLTQDNKIFITDKLVITDK